MGLLDKRVNLARWCSDDFVLIYGRHFIDNRWEYGQVDFYVNRRYPASFHLGRGGTVPRTPHSLRLGILRYVRVNRQGRSRKGGQLISEGLVNMQAGMN